MINSPWEIKKTSFGESLHLSPALTCCTKPSLLPLSSSHSPGNWSALMDHFSALQSWGSTGREVKSLQEQLFQQTSPSDVQLREDFSADNKHQWKYFSCSLGKRRMGSLSIYDRNKGLGKRKCLGSSVTMVTTPFGRPNWFQFVDRMICNWVSEKCGVHHISTETTHF